MMCPAEIFANSLIIKANGFVNIPTISIGIMIGIKANGTPGGLKICPQYVLFPERFVTIKVMKDKTRVTAIFCQFQVKKKDSQLLFQQVLMGSS